MLICSTCNTEQDSGKFCGECGEKLITTKSEITVDEQVATTENQTSSNPSPKKQSISNSFDIQEELSQYGSFLLNLLKNPTQALWLTERHFMYGIINLLLYVITFSFSIYFLLRTIFKNAIGILAYFGGFGSMFDTALNMPHSLPIGSIVFHTGFRGIIFVAIAFISTFIFSKLVTNNVHFKDLFAQYGGILTPLLATNLLAILFGLFGLSLPAFTLIVISFMLMIIIIPALIVFDKGRHPSTATQKIYHSFGVSVVSLLGSYLIIKNGFSNTFGDLTELIDFFNYF